MTVQGSLMSPCVPYNSKEGVRC